MATTLGDRYGLTTEDALAAYRRGRLDLLTDGNRWKPFLLDHAAGVHAGRPDRFRRICLACQHSWVEKGTVSDLRA